MISGVIISYNEAHNIERSINSLNKLVDEVIVVDSQSTDDTRKLAKALGAKVFNRKWEGYGPTKNFANAQANYDWILSLDADEKLSEALISELKHLQLDDGAQYQTKIVMDYLGKLLRFTEYAPHFKPRLFNKKHYVWDERMVHEKLIPLKNAKSIYLDAPIYHYSFVNRQHHIDKIDNYARLSALEMIRKGIRPSSLKRIFGPGYRFLRSYLLKLGILEGKEGLFISKMGGEVVRRRMKYFDQLSK